MTTAPTTSEDPVPADAHERRLGAMRLQEIEGNPLDANDLAMFEMFDREDWTHEQRRAHIIAQAKGDVPLAAE